MVLLNEDEDFDECEYLWAHRKREILPPRYSEITEVRKGGFFKGVDPSNLAMPLLARLRREQGEQEAEKRELYSRLIGVISEYQRSK